jgi:predicted PurR-regulated permease PerM
MVDRQRAERPPRQGAEGQRLGDEQAQPELAWRGPGKRMAMSEREATRGADRRGMAARSWWWYATLGAMALILGLGILAGVYLLARPIELLILGISLSAALNPATNWLDRWMPRALAVLLVFVLLAGIAVGLGWAVVPTMVSEGQMLAQQIPSLVDKAQTFFSQRLSISGGSVLSTIVSQLGTFGSLLVSLPVAASTAVLEILVVLAIAIYSLYLYPQMADFAGTLVPEEERETFLGTISAIGSAMGGYIRGIVYNGAAVGVFVYIGLTVIGVNFSLVLAILAGSFETIPSLGPTLSGIIITLFALLQSPTKALFALLFMIAMQQLENHILVPNIMRSQTTVSPLLVVFALVAGGSIGGLLGVLAAVPLIAGLRVFVVRVVAPAVRRVTGAPEPKPPDREDGKDEKE